MKPNTLHLAAAAALALCATSTVHAQAGTGSLAGWSTLGDVVSLAGALQLSTAYLGVEGDEPHNLSGDSAVDIVLVEAGASLPPYALDLPEPEYAREGSLASQTFDVAAGDTLRFEWSFSTVEDLFQDHAFVVLNGQALTLATRSQPGAGQTAWTHTFAGAGPVTLALGIVNTGDYLGVSTLAVSNLSLTPVPEPATLALWLAGLGLLGGAARRR